MVGDPYEAFDDPACGASGVLINLAGLQDQAALNEFEAREVGFRSKAIAPFNAFTPAE